MSFQLLAEEIERGLIGLNEGIPMGFDRLSRYVGIRKKNPDSHIRSSRFREIGLRPLGLYIKSLRLLRTA